MILNHTPGYIACFDYDAGTPILLVFWHLFVGMLVKVNVPIFYMITGTLMLNKDIRTDALMKKTCKFFVILLVFSLIANVANKGYLYLPGFIRTFASADVDGAGPYWYLYAYIGILLMARFMRYVAEKITLRDVYYLIVMRTVITGIIPMVFLFLNKVLDSNIHLASEFEPVIFTVDCVFYPVVGFGLDRKLDVRTLGGWKIRAVTAAFFLANLLECALTYFDGPENVFRGYDFLITISLFLIVKYYITVRPLPESVARAAALVSSLTLGIYLTEPIVGNFLKPLVHRMHPAVPSLLLVSVIYCVIAMTVCGTMTFCYEVLKRLVAAPNRR